MAAQPKEKVLGNYRLLGNTGLRVSPIGIGAMNFGGGFGGGAWEMLGKCSKEECFAILDEFVAAGGNFIDTADCYHFGKSEEWVGEWMKARGNREEIVLATKYTNVMKPGSINSCGPHRKHMMEALRASLKRLQTDYIDLYYVHFCDFTLSLAEVLRAMQDLVHAGHVHYLGVSDHPAWMVAEANAIAHVRGWSPFVAYQGEYSLLVRDVEREILPMCKQFNMGFIPWGAIAGGQLTGTYGRGKVPTAEQAPRAASPWRHPLAEPQYQVIDAVEAVAKELHATCAQVALAWVMANDQVPSALVGSRSLAQFKDNLQAAQLKFSAQQWARLGEASKIDLGWPHKMIGTSVESGPVRGLLRSAGNLQLPPYH